MASTSGTKVTATRRAVVAAAGASGLAAVLAACGGSDNGSGGAEKSPAAPTGGATTSAGTSGGGAALGKVTDIPEGGGKVFADQKVVVTQPTAGQFKCFSAVCTHMGCTVAEVKGGTINCPCHGSRFAVADGTPAAGPATKPLPEKAVTVQGSSVVLG